MKRSFALFPLVIGLFLAACSSTLLPTSSQSAIQPSIAPAQETPAQPIQLVGNRATQLVELTDSQGAVTVTIKPLDLSSTAGTLSFEVALDTHSVDLSMDLTALATLTTDAGMTVQATRWDAPLGGHHISGILSFPSSIDGKPILDGASKLTLIIKDVGFPVRIFAWDLE